MTELTQLEQDVLVDAIKAYRESQRLYELSGTTSVRRSAQIKIDAIESVARALGLGIDL